MANNIWSNYTEKTATPVDADEVMVRDSTDGKNKRLLFGTFWKWVAKKLNEATISELETKNKTVIGALNYLNGKTKKGTMNLSLYDDNDEDIVTAVFSVIPYSSCNLCIIGIANRVCIFFMNGYNPKLLGYSMLANVKECELGGNGLNKITLTLKLGKNNYLTETECKSATINTIVP
mgnify:CR=1 FL=1